MNATGWWDAHRAVEPIAYQPRHRCMSSDGANQPPPQPGAALPSAHHPVDDVVRMLTPRLRAVLRRCRLSEADVDDVLQDVWLRFLEHRDAIRHPERVAGWLKTIAVREAMRALSRCRAESPWEDVTTGVTPASADNPSTEHPGEDIARRDRDRTLWHVVASLPTRDRLLAHLIARAPGMSYADLATTLGVTQASVGQLRTRCLRRLRKALTRAGITAP